MKRQIIYILGDVHGNFKALNHFIDSKIRNAHVLKSIAQDCAAMDMKFDVLIFQAGDFAYYWPNSYNTGRIDNEVDFLSDGRVKIYWCGGNHEDWDQIDAISAGRDEKIIEMDRGIYFCAFGATIELANEKRVLFAGGAESIDKEYRIEKMKEGIHKIWWAQEGISRDDMLELEKTDRADIVISHTAPLYFNLWQWLAHNGYEHHKRDDNSRIWLNSVFDRYHPQKWFFGHFHQRMRGKYKNCEWLGLPSITYEDCDFAVIDTR